TLQSNLEAPINATAQIYGFLFRSEDKVKIFQATLNEFTFNRLKPYTTWEELRDDARYMWEIYRNIARPETVTRVAIRFVNRFELPGSTLDLKEYLRIFPELTSDLPQNKMGNFFMQLLVPQEDCQLIISEAVVPPTNPNTISVILDFDLLREQIWKSDDDKIWQYLEKLRQLKNVIFEASITDQTRRLIA
ncbi:MAG: TIGR04255 family protein, partial [Ktedonobacteraceae bacterium]